MAGSVSQSLPDKICLKSWTPLWISIQSQTELKNRSGWKLILSKCISHPTPSKSGLLQQEDPKCSCVSWCSIYCCFQMEIMAWFFPCVGCFEWELAASCLLDFTSLELDFSAAFVVTGVFFLENCSCKYWNKVTWHAGAESGPAKMMKGDPLTVFKNGRVRSHQNSSH